MNFYIAVSALAWGWHFFGRAKHILSALHYSRICKVSCFTFDLCASNEKDNQFSHTFSAIAGCALYHTLLTYVQRFSLVISRSQLSMDSEQLFQEQRSELATSIKLSL